MTILKIFRTFGSFPGKFTIAHFLAKSILNKKELVTFMGKRNLRYTIPNTIEPVGKELLINGIYERKTIVLVEEILTGSSVFFDVGANIGSITLPVAKSTGADVHSFEPSRFTYQFLEKNVTQNCLTNVSLNNNAVHSVNGLDLQFYEAEEKYGNSSLSATYSQQPHYSVKTISLDAYCERLKIDKIKVLKIDVQGYEIEVLKGAQNLIKNKAIDTIIFEMESWAEEQAGYQIGASQEFLLMNGYELFTLEKMKLNKVLTTGSHMFLAKLK